MEGLFQVGGFVLSVSGFYFSFARPRPGFEGWVSLMMIGLLFLPSASQGQIARSEPEPPKPPELKVSGYGLFGNRELKRLIELLGVRGKEREYFDAQFVEDAALVLISRLQRDGFLKPAVRAVMVLDDGSEMTRFWDEPLEDPLPRSLRVKRLGFHIREGIRYWFEGIEFAGLKSMSAKEARAFFIEAGALLPLRTTRIFTPQNLERGLANMIEVLERNGFERAKAAVTDLQRDDNSGRVRVTVRVEEGPKSIVRSIRRQLVLGADTQPVALDTIRTNHVFSKLWVQDVAHELRTHYYRRGYPDVNVEVTSENREHHNNRIEIDLLATIRTGAQVVANSVQFEGHEKTKQSVLNRHVPLSGGDLLDRVAADEGRVNLARLGVFDSVELDYRPIDEHRRDVVYRLDEGKQFDVSLLFGYGSYELLRGGVELEQFNVFGRAHHSRLKLVQSFRSSNADYSYTMPELLGEDIDVFLNSSGLRREEISFVREEFGGGMGARRYFKAIESELSVRYNYQVLNAADPESDIGLEGLQSAAVGAVITDFRHDRRDNPLYPHSGYKLFSNVELATEYLGGDVNYQRLELLGSYHRPLDPGRWLHVGVSHGVVFSVAGSVEDLPFNRRFFPGGENSVRGFQQGEAAPRDRRGKIVGAETYFGSTIEFEQQLTASWSLVGFVDSVAFARRIEDYPGGQMLFSSGAGIRWKTLIGPVRLEYGRNLNPRPDDPSGTLHFSIGFPF